MPTLDTLAPDRRAIIELVVGRSQTYAQIAEALGLSEDTVRSHARDSLADLAPRTAERVDADWRGQVADYLLGQQVGPEATATRGHLRSSEPARAWALSVLDSLADLYPADAVVEIPEPGSRERGRREPSAPLHPAAAPSSESAAATRVRPVGAEGLAYLRRRRMLGALAALAVVVVIAIVVNALSGDEGSGSSAAQGDTVGAGSDQPVVPVGLLELKPEKGEKGEGLATLLDQEGQPGLLVQATLDPSSQDDAYEVWLYNSPDDAVSVGAQQADEQGNFVGTGPLPTDFAKYEFIDVSREPVDDNADHSGDSVLRGKLADVKDVPPELLDGSAGAPPVAGDPGAIPEAPPPPTQTAP